MFMAGDSTLQIFWEESVARENSKSILDDTNENLNGLQHP